jgi:hypothetical protein
MSGVGGFRMQRIVNDGTDRAIEEAERSAGSRSILFDPGKSEAMESIPPKSTGIALSAQLEGDLFVLSPFGGTEDDLGSKDKTVGSGTAPGPTLKSTSFL